MSVEELYVRAEQALALARAAGAGDAWASASESRGLQVEVRDGNIETVRESTSRALSLRLYVEGRYGTYQTSDPRPSELARFVRDAVAITRALEPDPFRALPDRALFSRRPAIDLELVDPHVHTIDAGARVAACMEMVERARQHPRLVSATASVSDSFTRAASLSTNGFSGSHERTAVYRSASATLRDDGDARPLGHFGDGARHLEDLALPAFIGDEALRQAARRLGAQKGPTRRATLVIEPRVAGRLIGLLLGPASARAFSQERSFLRGRLGERVTSPLLSITDDPTIPRGLASRYYDGEGIAARPHRIIDEGALTALYVDTYYGRKIDMAPTTGASSNLIVALGARSLAEIVRDAPGAILVTGWLGGNSDPTTGDFSLGVRGHAITSEGDVGAPLSEMNLTGNVLELFARLVEVGNDPWTSSSTRVPTLVFEGADLGGTS